jgi:diguanylate cyclase (GGDEF)-like protein/PAS domain S-box-containing protein
MVPHRSAEARGDPAAGEAADGPVPARDVERRDAERQFRMLFERAPIGMGLLTTEGRWLRVNAALCQMTGYTEQELVSRTYIDVTHPDDVETSADHVARLVAGEVDAYQLEKRYIAADGGVLWVLLAVSLIRDADGAPSLLIAHLLDISERRILEARLRFLADHDPLTGLRNRRAFAQDLLIQIGRCQRYGEHAALLMLDLDGFKDINDRHGHTAGDDVLKAVAAALTAQVRSSDLVARLGGDEFAILLAHARPEDARAVAGHVTEAVGAIAVRAAGATLTPAVSIGIAAIDEDTHGDEEVLAEADSEMYRVKRARTARTLPQPPADARPAGAGA